MSDVIQVAPAPDHNRGSNVDMQHSRPPGVPPLASRESNMSNGGKPAPPPPAPVNSNGIVTAQSDQEVDVIFIDPLNEKYECPVCQQVLRYPVQFEECGHRCCSSCLPELLKAGGTCPFDQIAVNRQNVYVDKAFQNEVDRLGVRCSFYQRGCLWVGVLKDIMGHLGECNHRLVVCPSNCGVEFEVRFLSTHLADDCLKRGINCQFCGIIMKAEEEPTHLEVCPKFPVPCPNGCKKKEVPREELAAHLESKCLRQEQLCPFGDYGCEFRGVKRRVKDHLGEDYVNHLTLLCEHVKEVKSKVDAVEKWSEEVQGTLLETSRRLGNLEKYWGSQLIWKIDSYQEKFMEAKSGKKTTIFSLPFYTGRQGYRMAMSALLYGDGKARGKYMSLFVCICRGEYDALLPWPYCYPITFTLLDQCLDPEARRNITYVVRPNTAKENKPFLGRPMGERNASIGAQKFVELEILNTLDYIRDDTIYIQVSVDITDLPKI